MNKGEAQGCECVCIKRRPPQEVVIPGRLYNKDFIKCQTFSHLILYPRSLGSLVCPSDSKFCVKVPSCSFWVSAMVSSALMHVLPLPVGEELVRNFSIYKKHPPAPRGGEMAVWFPKSVSIQLFPIRPFEGQANQLCLLGNRGRGAGSLAVEVEFVGGNGGPKGGH